MLYQRASRILVAGAVALLAAACGGGGGGGAVATSAPPPPPDPSLQVSGTAAVGAALANAPVQVKCATGSGSATTAADGSFTVAIQGGALPCMVKVAGSSAGTPVTLHSVADSGSTNAADAVTSARANVTPLTELIVTQLTGSLPEARFASFDTNAAGDLSASRVAAAADAVLAILKAAAIDPGAVDPLKGALVAASGAVAGDAHDRLLDLFAARVNARALPQLVNEIAIAAAAQPAAAATKAAALLGGGTLAGCPTALSGSYRSIDLWGRTARRTVDFRAMKIQAFDGTLVDMVADAASPCTFTAVSTFNGRRAELSVAMGTRGVGVFRTRSLDPDSSGIVGYLFPDQAHAPAGLAGAWLFLYGGTATDGTVGTHGGQLAIDADGRLASCTFELAGAASCSPASTRSISPRADGGFDVPAADAAVATRFYAYRAPDGRLTLFGTTTSSNDPEGAPAAVLVAARLQALPLPALGETERFWETGFLRAQGMNSSFAPVVNMLAVTQVDAATGTVVRTLPPQGPSFTYRLNQPLAGSAARDASPGQAATIEVPLPGLGVTVSVSREAPAQTGELRYLLRALQP